MNVVLASIFRNSTGYLDRCFDQAARLRAALEADGHTLRLLLAEGDSSDGTWEQLQQRIGSSGRLLKLEHGGPEFGSVDNEQRWRQISFVCNGLLAAVPQEANAVIYVESDLIWEPETMLALLGALDTVPAVSPMSFHQAGFFYDTWGFRRNGIRFQPNPPYHPDLHGDVAMRIDSAGSCIVMRGEVARSCRFDPPELGIVGFCRDIYRHGYSLTLLPAYRVVHP